MQDYASFAAVVVVSAVAIIGCVYRLYLSPLSRYPGPKLAAVSYLWQTYMRYHGLLPTKLEQQVKETGPIVRMGPNHLCFWDADAYRDIYVTQKFPKQEGFYSSFQIPYGSDNLFSAVHHTAYLNRKRKLMPLMSRQAVLSLQGLFQQQLGIFVSRIRPLADGHQSVNLFMAFRCLTMDVITLFSFGEAVGALQTPDFHANVATSYDDYLRGTHLNVHYPWLASILLRMPTWVQPNWLRGYLSMVNIGKESLERFQAGGGKQRDYPVLFSQHVEFRTGLTDDELVSDASLFVGAGGDTSGVTLSIGAFYITRTPGAQERLFAELQAAYPDMKDILTANVQDLEKLPFLSACIYESLRIAVPVSADLPRVVTGGDWHFKGYVIPNGTTVSSNAVAVHFNEQIFPEAHEFKPERWLDAEGRFSNKLEQWLVSFGKGPRSCLGQSMAMVELYLFMAAFFRLFRVDMVSRLEDIKLQEHFVTSPIGHDCSARLEFRAE